MAEQLQVLAQQKGAPNLYWALTKLPQPLVDFRKGLEAESVALVFSFPELRDLESKSRTPDQWRDLLLKFWTGIMKLTGEAGPADNVIASPEALTAISLRGYPIAKQGLVERGFSAEAVEAMPVAQVILLFTLRQFEELRDELFKWFYVPYAEGLQGAQAAEKRLETARAEFIEVLPVASLLLPAVGNVRSAVVRADRQIAVLRIIERCASTAPATRDAYPRNWRISRRCPCPSTLPRRSRSSTGSKGTPLTCKAPSCADSPCTTKSACCGSSIPYSSW